MTDVTAPQSEPEPSAAADAHELMRRALKGALGTHHRDNGHPYASLVTVATEPDGSPIVLISTLAEHTQNLLNDSRGCILFDGTDGLGDPLEGGRVSVFGRMEVSKDPVTRRRFLLRHPSAALYADFTDFDFYRLRIEGAHFVGGFGRIHDLTSQDLLTDLSGAESLIEAEEGVVEHMNEDHADAVELYATRLLGAPAGPWRFAGCDPDGCDLVLEDRALRLDFPDRVTSPGDIRRALATLAEQARAAGTSA